MKLNLVAAHVGAHWMGAGVRAFFRRPMALTGLFFMFMATLSLAALVPLVGGLLALALVPATTVGLMAATREVDAGRFPMPLTLFIALRQGPQQTRAMLLLGVLYAIAVLLVLGASALVDDGRFASLYVMGGGLSPELMNDADFRTAAWVAMLLYLPVSLAFWHAPALVHWHAMPLAKSLFFSLVAVLRNARAFLVYGALWLALSSLIGLVLMMVLLLSAFRASPETLTSILVPLSLLIAAMFFNSLWFTFRDSFDADSATQVDSVLV